MRCGPGPTHRRAAEISRSAAAPYKSPRGHGRIDRSNGNRRRSLTVASVQDSSTHKRGKSPDARAFRGVHCRPLGAIDRHSSQTVLAPPTVGELETLVRQLTVIQSASVSAVREELSTRSLRRRLSPQQVEEVVARYNAGEDTPALSRAYGISRGGLRKLLLAEGVSFRKQPMTPENAERAIRLYERGLTIDQVVDQVGYSFNTVRRMLHAKGVAARERGGGIRVQPGERP